MVGLQISGALLLFTVQARAATLWKRSSCSCLHWNAVYGQHGVACGSGYELKTFGVEKFPLAKAFMPEGLYGEFCTNFYQKVSFNSCFNSKFGTPSTQWCYTSKDCAEATPVNDTDVGVKMCGDGDDFMNVKTPEELNSLAAVDHLEIGLFGKMSYPMEAMKWSEVESASDLPVELMAAAHTMESFYGLKWGGLKPATESAKAKIKEVVDAGKTTIFDADNGHGGGVLIAKSKIYGFQPLKGQQGLGYACMSDHGKPCA
mmetsp:Transcript_3399/g.6870  ORF Transcript_3399/g.6870 Transcript_3399/m.6870 type:complete len:259 (+) Transcript_3399:1-777(+)